MVDRCRDLLPFQLLTLATEGSDITVFKAGSPRVCVSCDMKIAQLTDSNDRLSVLVVKRPAQKSGRLFSSSVPGIWPLARWHRHCGGQRGGRDVPGYSMHLPTWPQVVISRSSDRALSEALSLV